MRRLDTHRPAFWVPCRGSAERRLDSACPTACPAATTSADSAAPYWYRWSMTKPVGVFAALTSIASYVRTIQSAGTMTVLFSWSILINWYSFQGLSTGDSPMSHRFGSLRQAPGVRPGCIYVGSRTAALLPPLR